MAASPTVPTNITDPTGTKRAVAGASNDFNKRLNAVFNGANKIIKELDYNVLNVNKRFVVLNQLNVNTRYKYNWQTDEVEPIYIKRNLKVNESFYSYQLSQLEQNRIGETIKQMIERLFMVDENGNMVRIDNARQLWFMDGYIEPQYQRGTNQAFNNLALQSDVYASAVQDVEQIFLSPQYQRRINAVAAREFELMEGFTADFVKETRRVLGDGIALGKSPREIASELQSRIGVSKSRAKRISATEIPGALRRANREEGRSASVQFGIKTGYLWMSAFKQASRKTHIARSGHYHTASEDEEFYGKDGNAIHCYCTQIVTVLDEDGKPLNDLAQKKVNKIKKEHLAQSPN